MFSLAHWSLYLLCSQEKERKVIPLFFLLFTATIMGEPATEPCTSLLGWGCDHNITGFSAWVYGSTWTLTEILPAVPEFVVITGGIGPAGGLEWGRRLDSVCWILSQVSLQASRRRGWAGKRGKARAVAILTTGDSLWRLRMPLEETLVGISSRLLKQVP